MRLTFVLGVFVVSGGALFSACGPGNVAECNAGCPCYSEPSECPKGCYPTNTPAGFACENTPPPSDDAGAHD